ncbi:cell division protein FtsQ/DivIB [Sphingosinicella terrae]|jgi:cell division protein FtsQ|uniref:cell division protein FtsQ/DivIB n=1 Tax=Sphingosinicella terrae TaxID=2172047 RepID=UPI000E0D9026|nr:cell division protein FtsQ/DivIB [Sphingosinicella terrae]
MSARIARGNGGGGGGRGGARSGARPRQTGRSVNTRRPKNQSLLDSFGLPAGAGRRIGGWAFALIGLVLVVTLVLAFRLPQLAGAALAESIGGAGFTMQRVEIKGAERVSRLDIYNVAFDQPSMAMPLVDLQGTRERLLQFGWIKEARVHRRLPDTLVVDIVERRPAAIWQNNRRLSLIDAEGVVLEPVRIDAMPELPLVIGPGANRHLNLLDALLASTPHLRPQVAGAAWIGGRRWDIRFQTGEVLSLPEGDRPSRRAILHFARMDQQTQLLGRGFVRFDMRIPGRFIVRVSRQPGTSVPELVPPDPGPTPPDLARTI